MMAEFSQTGLRNHLDALILAVRSALQGDVENAAAEVSRLSLELRTVVSSSTADVRRYEDMNTALSALCSAGHEFVTALQYMDEGADQAAHRTLKSMPARLERVAEFLAETAESGEPTAADVTVNG